MAACAGAVVAAVLVVGQGSAPAAQQRVVTASRGVVQSTVTGSGTLEAPETDVNFSSSGQLTHVYVHAGQHVVEGQKLASIDSSDAEISVEQAQANLRSADAKLEQAEAGGTSSGATPTAGTAAASPKRPSQSSSGSNSSSNAESAATKAANIASAQADVDSAQLAVDSANKTLSDTTLTAPGSGTVASVSGSVGDMVSGGASASGNSGSNGSNGSSASNGSNGGSGSSSSAFVVIVDRGGMTLQVPFSESDIHKIKKHQPATITVNALPGLELAAHVRSIDTLPTTNNSVVSYTVTFALDQKSSSLKPGMTATAAVVVTRVNDAVNVPTSAISRRGGTATVNLWKNGKSTIQPVVTGLAGDSTTQIISGLKAGDEVAIAIANNLGSSSSSSPFGNRGSGTLGGGGGGFLGGGGGGGGLRRPVIVNGGGP